MRQWSHGRSLRERLARRLGLASGRVDGWDGQGRARCPTWRATLACGGKAWGQRKGGRESRADSLGWLVRLFMGGRQLGWVHLVAGWDAIVVAR
jgi:uncharacterized protein YfiM (DUF2279 family)